VAQRLALGQLAAEEGQGPALAADRAGPAAVGARLLRSQGIGVLAEQDVEGAFGQAGRGGAGDLLHGLEIDLRAGAGVTEGAAGDDFAPLGSEVTDVLEVLGGGLTTRHGLSCLVLARLNGYAFLLLLYRSALGSTKLFLASGPATARHFP
jgi:hypothetical protein